MRAESKQNYTTYGAYNFGHPWCYLLGNSVLTPKQIQQSVRSSSYRGYRQDEVLAASNRCEPKRSQLLREIRQQIIDELGKDISRYRKCVFELRRYWEQHGIPENPTCCDDIHVAVSLKHNHIYNGFAHLALRDELPAQQGDLFGL